LRFQFNRVTLWASFFVGSRLKCDKDFTHFNQNAAAEYAGRSRMATGSELQLIIFTHGNCAKSRPNFELTLFGVDHSQSFLRRADKPWKCFVSGETESVANTSAFVGPVALIFAGT